MRGVAVVEDVDEYSPPQDGRVVGDDDDDDFPLREGSSPGGITRRRAKVLLPKFRLETVALRLESPLLIFFLGQNDLYTRRRAPEVALGEHNPPGRAQVGCAHLVGLL